jgi:chromosome segregation ATPase
MSKDTAAAARPRADEASFAGWEHASAATRLLQRRRQMFEVQDALEAQKKEHAEREAAFKKREAELEAQDLKLQHNLVNFSVFLQEKDTQRVNADKKAQEEVRLREQKDAEIKELLAVLERKKQRKAQVEAELDKNLKYHQYLDRVVEGPKDDTAAGGAQSAPAYSDISEVRDRWKTLNELREEVEEQVKLFLVGNDEYKGKLLTLEDAKQGEILEYQNEIQTLKDTLETMKLQTRRLQEEDARAQKKAQERTLKLGQISMACHNIFDRVQGRSTLKRASKLDDPVMILRASGSTLADLISIVSEYKSRHAARSGRASMGGQPHVDDEEEEVEEEGEH